VAPSCTVFHRALGFRLDLGDPGRDVGGGALRLLGQLPNALGNHCEAATVLTGARRLDCRIQREQVRLRRDAGDRWSSPLIAN
jgi:hypothetical protein